MGCIKRGCACANFLPQACNFIVFSLSTTRPSKEGPFFIVVVGSGGIPTY